MQPDPRWLEARDAITELAQAGELDTLESLWRELGKVPLFCILAEHAWRIRAYVGVEGAEAFLLSTESPPKFNSFGSTPEFHGGLLGFAHPASVLASLISSAKTDTMRHVLSVAVQERVLRMGAVDEPALREWATRQDSLPLETHPWERDLLQRQRPDSLETLANLYRYTADTRWPEGALVQDSVESPESFKAIREWGLDEEWDPTWPEGERPPSGPFVDERIYPNGHTWGLEVLVTDAKSALQLQRWPFPKEHVALSGQAEPITARRLFREWLRRGLGGGAYGSAGCAPLARQYAWTSLAALTGVDAPKLTLETLNAIAVAAESMTLAGFRARGPSIEHLGGDLGWVAVCPRSLSGMCRAFAFAHTDSD